MRLGWRRYFSLGMAMTAIGNVVLTITLIAESCWSLALLQINQLS
ncbi:MAG: hypothetical protein ACR2RF_04760 [Geminicoccaceae bacterium]